MISSTRWQQWAAFGLGLWLALSPWCADYSEHEAATANAVFVGLALALGSHFDASYDAVRAQWASLGAGLWLLSAPFVLSFDALFVPAATALSVGAFVVLLAASALSLDKEIGRWWDRVARH